MNNNFSYEDYCRIVGDLYLSAKVQENQFKQIIDKFQEQVTNLQKENRQFKECNTPNVSTS